MPRSRRLLVIGGLLLPALARADSFDNYTNPILAKAVRSADAKKIATLTTDQMAEHNQVLPGVTGAFVIVKTNEGRLAKLLVQPARQKTSETDSVPIALIERFVTFREGEEKRVLAAGQNVRLFGGFHFSLDIGQIVPASLGGDLRFIVKDDDSHLEPVGKAELYLVTKHLPEANPKKAAKLVVGAAFEARYFNGDYKLYDDGRRSGTLHLKVADNGDVTGHFFSDKDGNKYDVAGKVGNPPHAIQFRIFYPRVAQSFQGYLFTGDGRAITGTSTAQNRETGFYALRIEGEK